MIMRQRKLVIAANNEQLIRNPSCIKSNLPVSRQTFEPSVSLLRSKTLVLERCSLIFSGNLTCIMLAGGWCILSWSRRMSNWRVPCVWSWHCKIAGNWTKVMRGGRWWQRSRSSANISEHPGIAVSIVVSPHGQWSPSSNHNKKRN